MYLVDSRSRHSLCYPLGAGCIYPLGGASLVPSATTLITPRARVPLVAVLVVLVTVTFVLVTLVLIPAVSETLVLVLLVWVGPFTSTLVAFVLLVVAHQVRWYLSLVSYPGKMSFSCHITSPCASHALPTIESDQLQP